MNKMKIWFLFFSVDTLEEIKTALEVGMDGGVVNWDVATLWLEPVFIGNVTDGDLLAFGGGKAVLATNGVGLFTAQLLDGSSLLSGATVVCLESGKDNNVCKRSYFKDNSKAI